MSAQLRVSTNVRSRITILFFIALMVGAPLAPTANAAETATVTITSTLSPKNLEVTQGTIVTFKNNHSDRHRMTSEDGPVEFDFDLEAGESASMTFTVAGTYSYFDDRDDDNSAYFGTIVVTSTSGGGGTGGGGTGGTVVDMRNDTFVPRSITVPAGTTIRFTNSDNDEHTATAFDLSWQTATLTQGQSQNITFPTPGTWQYFCVFHADMTGTVIVEGTGGGTGGGATTTTTAPPPPPPPAAGAIEMGDNFYSPASRTVAAGTTVTWVNVGALPHTVTRTNSFDSGLLMPGASYSRTFTTAGTFSYFCIVHPSMTGTIVVTAATGGGGTTTTTAPPAGGGGTTTTTAPPSGGGGGGTGSIQMSDSFFSPASRTVTVGTTVNWINTGALPHTATATGQFDSGLLMPGGGFSHTFTAAGTYNYLCILHPGMNGTIIVTASTGGGGTTTTTVPAGGGATTTTAPGGTPPAASGDVQMLDNFFSPATKSVAVGATVTWANNGALPHTVTASGQFDSGLVMPGGTYSRTFTAAGTYDYLCILHPGMNGTIVVGAGGTGGGGGTDPGAATGTETDPTPAASGDVRMLDNFFSPATKSVAVGATVTWANNGALPHTVTASGQFDSGLVMPGGTYSRTFTAAGTYDYLCILHPGMNGTIVVGAGGTGGSAGTDGAAAGSGTDGVEATGAPGSSTPSDLTIIDNAYEPAALEIPVGTTLTWDNVGALPHTVTDRNGSFDSGFMMTGDTWSYTFDTVGSFEYFCIIHPEMVATVTVVDAPAAPADGGTDAGSGIVVSNAGGSNGNAAGITPGGLSTEAAVMIGLAFVLTALGLVGGMSWLGRSSTA